MSGSFLQSTGWEEFQKSLGRKTWRIGNFLVIKHDLYGGLNYLYCPRPGAINDAWLAEVRGVAREEGPIFLKIDPEEKPVTNYRLPVADAIQPAKTLVLDLQKSDNELLGGMHEKTRYNIRLAERRGVIVAPAADPTTTDILIWWNLLSATARRDRFRTHERIYYEKLLRTGSADFHNELFLADFNMTTQAAAIVNFYRPTLTATYLHGASLRESKEIMAPHLLHWQIVREAKRRGFRYYDFWGIDEKKWPGLTRFKMGFGGSIIQYPPSVDAVYRPAVYRAYRLARKII